MAADQPPGLSRSPRRAAGWALLLALIAAAAPGQPSETERFTTLERSWMDAVYRRDRARLETLLAPEFTITGAGSTLSDPVGSRQDWLENVFRFPWPEHRLADLRVVRAGEVAVVKLVLSGDYPPGSLTERGGRIDFLVTDVWIERDGRWQVLARHSSLPRPE